MICRNALADWGDCGLARPVPGQRGQMLDVSGAGSAQLGQHSQQIIAGWMPSRRQVASTLRIAAILGPAFSSPMCSQFLRARAMAVNDNYTSLPVASFQNVTKIEGR